MISILSTHVHTRHYFVPEWQPVEHHQTIKRLFTLRIKEDRSTIEQIIDFFVLPVHFVLRLVVRIEIWSVLRIVLWVAAQWWFIHFHELATWRIRARLYEPNEAATYPLHLLKMSVFPGRRPQSIHLVPTLPSRSAALVNGSASL